MKTQIFKNYIGLVNELVMSNALDTPRNTLESKGVDLLDSVKGVEVKSCLVDPKSSDSRKRYVKWTLFDNELNWDKKYDLPLYCAIGTYQLDTPISRLWTANINRLEKHVTQREFWIVPWSWTMEFPIKKGKCHDYRYIRTHPLASTNIPTIPDTKYTKPILKGVLHFTEGVNMEHFPRI